MTDEPLRFAVVGHGWRADFYHRLAGRLGSRLHCVGAVTRGESSGRAVERVWGVPTYRSVRELIEHADPGAVVTCVPRSANPDILIQLAKHDVGVLSETPPADTVDRLRELWSVLGPNNRVQVAEQHPYLPQISAVRDIVRSGLLGTPTSASVSWTHDYHAVAILRSVLGTGGRPAKVHAVVNTGPVLLGPDREGWAEAGEQLVEHIAALIDFGGTTGSYDFTDGQWFNPLRPRSLTVRGSHGTVSDRSLVRNAGGKSTVQSYIDRRNLGEDGNLEGFDLDSLSSEGHVVYENPYRGARLSDEEIAIARCLEATGNWVRDRAPAPYSLADACEDHAIALAIREAARTGDPVSTVTEPWSSSLEGPING